MRNVLYSALAVLTLVACGGDDKPKPKTPEQANALRGGAAETKPATSTTDVGAVEGAGNSGLTGSALSRYTEGWNAYLSGDLQTAKKKFQDAQAQDAKNPAPAHALGIVLERLGDLSGAQQSYRAAYTSDPNHDLSVCAYALSLAGSGHVGEADSFLQGQKNKKPSSARVTTCLADVKSIQNDHATAQQLAQDALRMDPDFKDAMVTIARDHYRARKLALADYALKAVLVGFGDASPPRDKDNAEAHLLRGLMLRETGSRAVALQDFEAAAKKRPDLTEALINLGSMRLEAGNAVDAAPVLESATKFAPNNALAHLNLGDAYRLLGKYAEAKKEFEIALSKDSSLAAAHYDLGLMFLTAPTIPGYSADQQVGAAIKELQSYRTMRGPKPPPGVQDDVDDLIQRANAKQAELKQTPAPAAAPAGGKPAAPPATKK